MHGYTLGLLHGEGHEVLYANHMYNEEEVGGSNCFSDFYEKQYLKLTKQLRIFDSKSKNYFFKV
jgi:tRNA (guanine-N7-)-methyltransferase